MPSGSSALDCGDPLDRAALAIGDRQQGKHAGISQDLRVRAPGTVPPELPLSDLGQSSGDTLKAEAVPMADAMIWGLCLLALISVAGLAGLLYDRLHPTAAPPCDWSEAEHWHAVIMSRYYREFGPSD
jgi:hypothetical protein